MGENELDPEKGRLLYQEKRTVMQRFERWEELASDIMIIIFSFVIFSIGVYNIIIDKNLELPVLMMILLGSFLCYFGLVFFRKTAKKTQFQIYEHGIALPQAATLRDAFLQRENFICWEQIEQVKISEEQFEVENVIFKFRHVELTYCGKTIRLAKKDVSDSFEMLLQFNKYIPEKMNDRIMEYLVPFNDQTYQDDGDFDDSESPLYSLIMLRLVLKGTKFLLLGFLGLVIGLLIISREMLILTLLPLFSGMIIWLFYKEFNLAISHNSGVIERKTIATKKGIALPDYLLTKSISKLRSSIPWEEIHFVRFKLSDDNYSSQAEFETVCGERFRVPFSILEAAVHHPGFRVSDYQCENSLPGSSKGPIWSWNRGKIVLSGILAGISFIVGFWIGFS